MLTRPLLRPDLRAVVLDGETVVLFGERGHFRLAGRPVADVLPLLDGARAPEEVVAALDGRVAPEEVYYALLELERRGYVVDADGAPRERVALLAGLGVAPERLRGARVRISTLGDLEIDALRDALAEVGVEATGEASLTVALTDDYLREDLEEENHAALASGRAWLLAKPVGAVLWLGPLFVPGETGCWACLAHRLRGHRPVEEVAAALEPGVPPLPPRAATTATTGVATGLIAAEVAKELAGGGSTLRGRLLTLDLVTLAADEHALPKRPHCPACGDPTLLLRLPGQPGLRPLRARARAGGERVRAPDETVRRLSALVSPITGVVSTVERIDGLPAALHLYTAGPVPRPTDAASPEQIEATLRSPSGGKGPTDAQARASALCEGVERYCACWREPRHVVAASYLEVAERAVHPDRLLLFSTTQRSEREARNADDDDARSWIPEPFDDTRPVDWTSGWSISGEETRLVPTAYCFLDYPLPQDHRFCRADSNGCAAGNEPEEAILQGLLELVERDAVALWWYNRIRRPGIDFASSRSPYVAAAVEAFATLGRAVWALDLTNDLGITAIAALSCSHDGRGVTYGFGAHLDAEIALGRALSELTQMTHAVRTPVGWATLERWLAEVTPATDTWLAPEGHVPLPPAIATGDLAAAIRVGVDAIARAGHETIVVDQTLPDVGVPVVKVVAPALRHFFPRFAPGRLYDVPVALGWLEQPTPEADLNPYPVVW